MRFLLLSWQFNLIIMILTNTAIDNINNSTIYSYFNIEICNKYEKCNKLSNI